VRLEIFSQEGQKGRRASKEILGFALPPVTVLLRCAPKAANPKFSPSDLLTFL